MRPRPDASTYRRDAIVALALLVGMSISALLYNRLQYYDDPAPLWVTVLVILGSTVPLAFRHRFPLVVAIVVSAAFFALGQLRVPELLFANITLFLAIYSLGAWGRNRRVATVARILIIVAMFVWIIVNLVISSSDPELLEQFPLSGIFSQFAAFALVNFLTNLLYFGGAFLFGNAAWRAAREHAELEARTDELAAERERTAQQAVALDRVRIARELHDVVAHHVSVMGVQAGAARRVMASDPDAASASLETVEQSARAAVDELHRMLTTLRETDGDSASTSSSTRGLEQLDELLEESTSAGTPARLQVVGAPRPITPLVGFTLYRVAQEALTNTRKHAGSGATADVRLRYLDAAVELEVTDSGVRQAVATTGGLGLIGMRERVAAVGGTLEAGPRARGGYLVRATIPEAAR
jgi:signal transduction histidine kinase